MTSHEMTWKWDVGVVNPATEHIELRYGDAAESEYESWRPIALIGKPSDRTFPVTWIADLRNAEEQPMVEAARKELDFYLVEKKEANPWAYACYHCNTCANMYSRVHWSHLPHGRQGERQSSQVITIHKAKPIASSHADNETAPGANKQTHRRT